MNRVKKITYSAAFQVFLYFLLAFSFMTGILASAAAAFALSTGIYKYDGSLEKYRDDAVMEAALRRLDAICYDTERYQTLEAVMRACEADSEGSNLRYAIETNTGVIWSNQDGSQDAVHHYMRSVDREFRYGQTSFRSKFIFTVYVYRDFTIFDEFWRILVLSQAAYYCGRASLICAAAGILLCITAFVWLLCNAGHRSGREGVAPGRLHFIPLDLLTALYGVCAAVPIRFYMLPRSGQGNMAAAEALQLAALLLFELLWFAFFARELALRVKLGKEGRNTLVFMTARFLVKAVKVLARSFAALVRCLPLFYSTAAVLAVLTGLEFAALMAWGRAEPELIFFWSIEKLIVSPLVLYCALAFKKLQLGGEALAEGDLSCKLETKYLYLDFGRHADSLNRIGDGMAKAVEQRMRSERLKTELITNVSHDIKTPLTSVINYADLLSSEAEKGDGVPDREKLAEYAEVLTRQSKRLKKLLDDLLEASKANTGSLEVNLLPCGLGVMLTQATGEYEARFAEKELALHIRQPEEEICIMADGRHLWRVFDNLLGNIYKYAQEGSRVYLDLEKKGERVEVVFRNMSKYELEVSARELEERFVRGDKSRNMEGNGLGLSIAKSLVELQNGSMEIVTDGDLFKVVLEFAVI